MTSSNETTPVQARETSNGGVVDNPWRKLREFTDARIGLGRAGISLPTRRLLEFQLAHAQAKDAVHLPLDVDALADALGGLDAPLLEGTPIVVHSQAEDRITYLQRPDLGRRLDEASRERLTSDMDAVSGRRDLALVVVDGLSSLGVQTNAAPFVASLCNALADDEQEWQLAPTTIVEQGRVAIGDEIGELLNANAVLVLVGERPGLSSPDSLGLYLTWNPNRSTTDADRNCISNVRAAGLPIDEAAQRALYLLRESRQRELTGVKLKDRSGDDVIEHDDETDNFLVS